ncbi:hypothetical protein GCM10012278_44110 [Nonomuraea glycinis]|uniref:Uncharacterized protein n=1 Tax=Nonomuraea glycinis TaxID=2047744 RepID=A0A918E7D7_9ACTN|nr:hypothetical protein GCM10012278_44110 [Nonomuraea glycinis]
MGTCSLKGAWLELSSHRSGILVNRNDAPLTIGNAVPVSKARGRLGDGRAGGQWQRAAGGDPIDGDSMVGGLMDRSPMGGDSTDGDSTG